MDSMGDRIMSGPPTCIQLLYASRAIPGTHGHKIEFRPYGECGLPISDDDHWLDGRPYCTLHYWTHLDTRSGRSRHPDKEKDRSVERPSSVPRR